MSERFEVEDVDIVDDVVDEIVEDEYVPNYDYKVKDETLKFDERVLGSIKSKEDEDYYRDLYTRAAGLDSYKAKVKETESQAQTLIGGYKTLQDLRDGGDIRGLQKALGLSDDAILDFATELLDEDELPEEQKTMMASNRTMQSELDELRTKVSGYDARDSDARVLAEKNELSSIIKSDTYSEVSNAMAAVGHDMSAEVIREGTMMYNQSGVEPSIAEVVKIVHDRYSYITNLNMSEKKQVIPSVKGGNTNAIQTEITSLEQLRKLAGQIQI